MSRRSSSVRVSAAEYGRTETVRNCFRRQLVASDWQYAQVLVVDLTGVSGLRKALNNPTS